MKYRVIIELNDIPDMDERHIPAYFEDYIKEVGITEEQIELIEE